MYIYFTHQAILSVTIVGLGACKLFNENFLTSNEKQKKHHVASCDVLLMSQREHTLYYHHHGFLAFAK